MPAGIFGLYLASTKEQGSVLVPRWAVIHRFLIRWRKGTTHNQDKIEASDSNYVTGIKNSIGAVTPP